MSLSENIKKIRKEAVLTKKKLANKSGLSFSMISRLESGDQVNPSFETIRRISDLLEISPSELVHTSLSIEDQIDEYIEYKRGLKGSRQNSSPVNFEAISSKEENCLDLNFKKKMFAINNAPISLDYCLDESPENPDWEHEVKRLYSSLKNATRDEINQVIRLFETLKR